MIIHDEPLLHIYFGDAGDRLYKEEYLTWQDRSLLHAQPSIKSVIEQLQIQKLFFLRQVHSTQGYCVDTATMESLQPFTQEGDYLITQCAAIGLGVMAADCLPVICFDKEKKTIGIAHAGWRGALAGVIQNMLTSMQQTWQTNLKKCEIFLGPSARKCCYQVGPEFEQYLALYPGNEEILQKRKDAYFFDLPLLISYQLQNLGITKGAINTMNNICTICNDRFYSHRRTIVADYNGRQMTIVALK